MTMRPFLTLRVLGLQAWQALRLTVSGPVLTQDPRVIMKKQGILIQKATNNPDIVLSKQMRTKRNKQKPCETTAAKTNESAKHAQKDSNNTSTTKRFRLRSRSEAKHHILFVYAACFQQKVSSRIPLQSYQTKQQTKDTRFRFRSNSEATTECVRVFLRIFQQ